MNEIISEVYEDIKLRVKLLECIADGKVLIDITTMPYFLNAIELINKLNETSTTKERMKILGRIMFNISQLRISEIN